MKKYLAVASILSLIVIPSCCASYRHTSDKVMKEIDTKENGEITKEEWNKYSDDKFEAIDSNDDGVITRDELRNYFKKARKRYAD